MTFINTMACKSRCSLGSPPGPRESPITCYLGAYLWQDASLVPGCHEPRGGRLTTWRMRPTCSYLPRESTTNLGRPLHR